MHIVLIMLNLTTNLHDLLDKLDIYTIKFIMLLLVIAPRLAICIRIHVYQDLFTYLVDYYVLLKFDPTLLKHLVLSDKLFLSLFSSVDLV